MAIADVRTGSVRTIAGVGTDDPSLAWSPDGGEIIFARPGEPDLRTFWDTDGPITVVTANGRRRRVIARGTEARWSPDGRKIVFASNGDLFVMNANGSQRRRITNGPSFDHAPDWRPLPGG